MEYFDFEVAFRYLKKGEKVGVSEFGESNYVAIQDNQLILSSYPSSHAPLPIAIDSALLLSKQWYLFNTNI